MDFSAIGNSLEAAVSTQLPRILGAIAILIIGWIVAIVVRAGIRRLLGVVRLNSRIADTTEQKLDLESGVAAGIFWLIILITLIGVFNSLDLVLASGPFEVLVKEIAAYIPHLVAGTVLLLVAWLAAIALRAIVNRVLDASGLDEKLSATAGMEPMRTSVGNMLFWLVLLLFLPAILDAYNLHGLLDPVRVMVGKALAMLPNVFAAFVIGFVGWLLGKVLAGLMTNILAAAGADRGAHRMGLDSRLRISQIVGTIVLIFVFVPALIAALDVLKIEAISRPATDMLGKLLAAVPNIVAAALILTVTYYVARFAAGLLARLLAAVGSTRFPRNSDLQTCSPAECSHRVLWRCSSCSSPCCSRPRRRRIGSISLRFATLSRSSSSSAATYFSAPSSSSSDSGWPTLRTMPSSARTPRTRKAFPASLASPSSDW